MSKPDATLGSMDGPLGDYGYVEPISAVYAAKPLVGYFRTCGHCGGRHAIYVLLDTPFVTWICQRCKHSNVEGADG